MDTSNNENVSNDVNIINNVNSILERGFQALFPSGAAESEILPPPINLNNIIFPK